MESDELFVYGTLRKGTSTDMYRLLAREADFISDARFKGQLYLVDYYPGLIPSDNDHDIVHGELYRMRRPDVVLRTLDEYEGCSEHYPEPKEYVRRVETVILPNEEERFAWVYIYNKPVMQLKKIESGDFLDIITDKEALPNNTLDSIR